jgi:LPXTG-motif cell wall-anchored protein
VISKPGTYPLEVKVPNCFTQVDLYVTDKKAVDFDFPNDLLGPFLASNVWPKGGGAAAFNGGTTGCVTETVPPTTTPPTATAPASTVPPAGGTPGTALPNTGASPAPKILLAVLLLAVGSALVVLGRRRRTSAG